MAQTEIFALWDPFQCRVIDHHKHVLKALASVIRPQSCSSSIESCHNLARELQAENEELFRENALMYPPWAKALAQKRIVAARPSVHDLANASRPPGKEEVLELPQLSQILQLANESDQSGYSRVPVNLLKSGKIVLNKLGAVYAELWASKEAHIQRIQQICSSLAEAAVTLVVEHLIANEVPRALHTIQASQNKLSAAHQQFKSNLVKLDDLLLQVRLSAIAQWKESQEAKFADFLHALAHSVSEDSMDFRSLEHAFMEFTRRIDLYSQNEALLRQPSAELQFLMRDWLQMIRQ